MSKVIQVLETMASDAYLINQENISTLLAIAEIDAEQHQAITEKNAEKLAETIADLPEIRSFSQVIPAEENEQEDEDKDEDDNQSIKQHTSSF